jgi:hypothetical protein
VGQRSTSIAGTAGGALAICLFGWRYYVDGICSRDLLAVGVTVVVLKPAAMVWSVLKE